MLVLKNIFWGDFQIFVQNMRVIVAPAEAKITVFGLFTCVTRCFRTFKVIYSCSAHQNTTFDTKFMPVGPCVRKLWPK